MNKRELTTALAKAVVNNWIATGDQPEENRGQYERTMQRVYSRGGLSMASLRVMLNQLTYPKGTGE